LLAVHVPAIRTCVFGRIHQRFNHLVARTQNRPRTIRTPPRRRRQRTSGTICRSRHCP
jgi:hypothetical protein